jgi:mannose/fructose/N-acetylgalactosamine-specific phosphotransferase system component IIC
MLLWWFFSPYKAQRRMMIKKITNFCLIFFLGVSLLSCASSVKGDDSNNLEEKKVYLSEKGLTVYCSCCKKPSAELSLPQVIAIAVVGAIYAATEIYLSNVDNSDSGRETDGGGEAE